MDALFELRLIVLESLKYISKAVSPLTRTAEAVISRNLTTS